jgi:hypothetical protein
MCQGENERSIATAIDGRGDCCGDNGEVFARERRENQRNLKR